MGAEILPIDCPYDPYELLARTASLFAELESRQQLVPR